MAKQQPQLMMVAVPKEDTGNLILDFMEHESNCLGSSLKLMEEFSQSRVKYGFNMFCVWQPDPTWQPSKYILDCKTQEALSRLVTWLPNPSWSLGGSNGSSSTRA
jgi:hypothetical protein